MTKWMLALGCSLVLLSSAPVRGDSIGPCPEGELVVVNPTEPDSMHHGGFHCEPDPNASHGCSASSARSSHAALAWLVAIGLGAAWRRRGWLRRGR